MPTLDRSTASGTLNSQAETWVKRPVTLRTSAVTKVTLDTIAIPTGTAVWIETLVGGRQTGNNTTDGERSACVATNVAGTVTVTNPTMCNAGGGPAIWSSASSGAAFLSFTASTSNVLVKLTPNSANQTDWQALSRVGSV